MARIPDRVNRGVLRKSKDLIAALQKEGLRIRAAYLYGSHAKGTAHEWSDIDVAVVSNNLSGNRFTDFRRLNMLATQIDSRMEVVGYIPKTFRNESPLVWEIKTTGIPLLGNGKNGRRRVAKRPSRRKADN